jgi:allantoicase
MSDSIFDRATNGRVIAFSDEGFAPAANLLATREPEFRFGVFIPGKGQEFDSWETRRHNPDPPDWVVIELGSPGPIGTIDIDTHWHDGNHAERAAVFALRGTPGENPARDDARWVEILSPRALDGHAHNVFRTPAGVRDAWTHVRLDMHPDGGIARLRCFAGAAPESVDPGRDDERHVRHSAAIPRGKDTEHRAPDAASIAFRWREIPPGAAVDLACESFGGRVVATSNNRYGHSQRLIAEAAPTSMGDGWETSRSRGPGHRDFVVVALGRAGSIDRVEVDFTYFVLNNPVAMRLLGANLTAGEDPPDGDDPRWTEIIARKPVKALAARTLHVDGAALRARGPFTHVRLETFPDGGANRLRVIGRAV